jgi:hypothetical protein
LTRSGGDGSAGAGGGDLRRRERCYHFGGGDAGQIPSELIPAEFNDNGTRYRDKLLDEAIAEIAEVEILHTRKGNRQGTGTGRMGIERRIISANLSAKAKANARGSKFRDFIAAVRAHWKLAINRATIMRNAERNGEFDRKDHDAYLDKLLGIDQQVEHDAAVNAEFDAMFGPSRAGEVAADDIPFSIGSSLNFLRDSFSSPVSNYTFQPAYENRSTVLRIAQTRGIELLSPDAGQSGPGFDRASATRIEELFGVSVVWFRGLPNVLGFSDPDARNLIFLNAEPAEELRDIVLSWTASHELIHAAQNDPAAGTAELTARIEALISPEEREAIRRKLAINYHVDQHAIELPAFLAGDAVSGQSIFGIDDLAQAPAIRAAFEEYFTNLEAVRPQTLKDATDEDLASFSLVPANPNTPFGVAKEGSKVEKFNQSAASDFQKAETAATTGREIFGADGIPKESSLKAIIEKVTEWGLENGLFGDHPTPSLGGPVRVTANSVKNDLSHWAGPEKTESLAVLSDMLAKAVFIQTEISGRGGVKSHILAAKLNIGGQSKVVSIVVRENEGKLFYDHEFVEKKEGGPTASQPVGTNTRSRLAGESPSVGRVVANALGVKPSPLSMAHASMVEGLSMNVAARIKDPVVKAKMFSRMIDKLDKLKRDTDEVKTAFRERKTTEIFDGAQHEQAIIALEDERQAAEDEYDQSVAELKAEQEGAIQDARAEVLAKLGPNNSQNAAGKNAYREAVRQAVAKVREEQKTKRAKLRTDYAKQVAKLDAKEATLAKRNRCRHK